MHDQRVVRLASASLQDWESRHGDEDTESIASHVAEVTDPYSILDIRLFPKPGGLPSAHELTSLQECSNKRLRNDREPPRRVPYIESTQKQLLSHGCQMDETCNNTPGEITKRGAPEVRLPELPETEVHRTMGRVLANNTGSAGSERLRSLCVCSEELHGTASLVEPPGVLQTNPTQRQTTQAALSNFQHPFHHLYTCQESLLGKRHRILQDSLLHLFEERLASSPIGPISCLSRFIHSSPERAPYGLTGLQQDRLDAAFSTLAAIQTTAEVAARHGTRGLASSPRTPVATKDAVIGALCEQILHQQWRLKVQETRLYMQERRLHQLENLLSSPHARQAWQQRQHLEEHLWEQSPHERARHPPANAKNNSHIMQIPSVISRARSTPTCLGTQSLLRRIYCPTARKSLWGKSCMSSGTRHAAFLLNLLG